MNAISKCYFRIINEIPLDFYSGSYGLVRSLFALGTLSTIFFNYKILFPLRLLEPEETGDLSVTLVDKLSIFYLFHDYFALAVVFSIIILLLSVVGFMPRIFGILQWWVSASLFLSSQVPDGGDQITAVITLLLIPFTLFDNRRWHWEPSNMKFDNVYSRTFLFSCLIIIKLQISILYFQAAVDKLQVHEWRDGTVLYYWFTHSIFGVNDILLPVILPILFNPFAITFLSWGVIIFELILFAAFFSNSKFKMRLFYFAVLFHFSIFIIHGLFSFFLAMTSCLILYLIPIEKNILPRNYFMKKAAKV